MRRGAELCSAFAPSVCPANEGQTQQVVCADTAHVFPGYTPCRSNPYRGVGCCACTRIVLATRYRKMSVAGSRYRLNVVTARTNLPGELRARRPRIVHAPN